MTHALGAGLIQDHGNTGLHSGGLDKILGAAASDF